MGETRRFKDIRGRSMRLTAERWAHIRVDHPEMRGQKARLAEVLSDPDVIVASKTDASVELYYRRYKATPVGDKHLCAVVKTLYDDAFIITAYFTDTVKKGVVTWGRR